MLERAGVHLPGLSRRQDTAADTDTPTPTPTTSGVVDCALYREGTREPGTPDVAELYEQARSTEGAFVWIGLHEPDETTFADIAEIFKLHPLAVEDVLHREQQPKLERYEDVTFLIVRAAVHRAHRADRNQRNRPHRCRMDLRR